MNKTKLFIITILAISVLAIPVEASTINYNASDCRKIVMKKGRGLFIIAQMLVVILLFVSCAAAAPAKPEYEWK